MKAELKPEELRATDLRIGNYVRRKSTGEEFAIDVMKISVIESDNHGIYEASFEPIELSEEWLKKAGFVRSKENTSWFENDSHLTISTNGSIAFYVEREWRNTKIKLQYVHQLQNLYYALTGNELIFNHG